MSQPADTTNDWHYIDPMGTQRGPIGFEALRGLARQGEIRRDTPTWRPGMAGWIVAISAAPQLFEGMALPPPIPQAIAYQSAAYVAAPPIGQDSSVRMLIPVGRSGWAIAAGYLGLFSVIPFFAPVALIIGLVALRDLRLHPESHGAGRAWFGVIMGTLFSIALVVGIVAVVMGK